MQNDLLINGIPLESFGGSSMLDYSIGETEITNEIFQGVDRSNWKTIQRFYGLRSVEITIRFEGASLRDAKMQRSRFNSLVYGDADIYIPDDGFFYRVYCESLGSEELVGIGAKSAQIKSRYKFKGIRHDALRTEEIGSSGIINCLSTMPFTDCRLTAKASAAGSNYNLGGCVFETVAKDDILVFDGINGSITKNGTNYSAHASWLHFPTLVPGMNTITVSNSDPFTVEYEPAYI